MAGRRIGRLLAAMPILFLAGSVASWAQAGAAEENASHRKIDFYVLSLSWAPSYCARRGDKADKALCDATPSYGFVVQGLWPQYNQGYPLNCISAGSDKVSADNLGAIAHIMPRTGSAVREWQTHGRCSGLTQDDYFATIRAAYKAVALPSDIPHLGRSVRPVDVANAFLKANPGLPRNGISVGCSSRFLREIHICLTTGLKFRSCPAVQQSMCRLPRVAMPPR
ncbi:MAG: ribonuclease [Rhizobiaceae bacterium]|nr:MAG: ribonuclease [Rhizobiaceae bacterium]